MKKQSNPVSPQGIEKLIGMNKLFNTDPSKAIASLIAMSRVILVFALLFIGAYVFKLLTAGSASTKHFKLLLSNQAIDILSLYRSNFTGFLCLIAYDLLKLGNIALAFFYFVKFLKSLDMQTPFARLESKTYIQRVAWLSVVFFVIDALGTLHLSMYEDALGLNGQLRLFHFEYLILAYFINVFAFIFQRGVDLHNEIELVI